ncbi:MAG TPA: hypothetical protein DCY48_03420 [Candidatus Magasanikbacteria bacterium]|nr:MAG: hypothetical protein A3I74_04140 [Candidatus Magasanikbacteria bacterium RIFCSPLOWO2_02_FULL_47_16]OGH79349.1 MAG: hypothetical protein A3C10_04680 [Candidatus Magasanikbacteria bacterium RIFCSPHIGHO2_02_FULL_48_18]OGH82882.1 MAG: hypothetical protein A3G08_02970 [Candidatus Magasanikbacteria bacterium RIFCSPLOWO2_12_FULL_47_9b]HAZ28793.1 hypothetical protein [Candidatus Magasanikbacteria bacterium]
MITIQLFGVIIGLSALHLTHLYYKRKHFTKKELIFWLLIWFGFLFIAIFPMSVRPIVGYLHLNRSMDLIMIIAFVIIFGLSFHNYVMNRRQCDKLERLVRELTMKDITKK